MLAFPEADVPVVAMSLHRSLDPEVHLAMGRALRPLRDDGVLILASGMSYHNMRGFRRGGGGEAAGTAFDADLGAAVLAAASAEARAASLRAWTSLRGARDAHPREEHFLPLLVAAGAADDDDAASRIFDDVILGAKVSAFAFQPTAQAATT
mmetsp:Transcript_3527/g.9054  ORF Transcript_3527/g.9054 Transcript_3527/m.9054 type:complete len:152 (+) Transcript_3527:476-931(+)